MKMTISRNPNLARVQNINPADENELMNNFKEDWFTGLLPEKCPGFNPTSQILYSLPQINLNNINRNSVRDYFNNSWAITEVLFSGIAKEEAYYRPPYHGLRHPMIFYYGHPAVLYLNKLRIAGLIDHPVDLYLEKVLETGVDEMSWDDMSKNEMKWPSVKEVHDYRKKIYQIIINLIDHHPDLDKSNLDFKRSSPWWALWMGIEHEKIHIETSSVLMRELPLNFVSHPKYFPPMEKISDKNNEENLPNDWIFKKGEEIVIGRQNDDSTYGWDNEFGERKVSLVDFMYSKYQISNGEFLEFVKSGNYSDDQFWDEEGLKWRKFRNTKRPTFWSAVGPEGMHQYELRTIFDSIPLPLNWPCEVNFHEAKAYVRFHNQKNSKVHYRLLSEAEWRLIASSEKVSLDKINFELMYSSPKSNEVSVRGNLWHWVEDQFNPLENFKTHYLYDDFSTPCFDGRHQMILGGSFISLGNESNIKARFHFRPHFHQHSGFRIAYSIDGSTDNKSFKLTDRTTYLHESREELLQVMGQDNWWKNAFKQPLNLDHFDLQDLLNKTTKSVLNFRKNFNDMNPAGEFAFNDKYRFKYQGKSEFPTGINNFESLLDLLFKDLVPTGQLPGHPGYLAYVSGGGNDFSSIANLISSVINPYIAHLELAPELARIEMEVINWFISLMGYQANLASGFFTSGASQATLSAMMIARQVKLKGEYNFLKVVGYTSHDAHHSVSKAWSNLGFNPSLLRFIDLNQLESEVKKDLKNNFLPFLVVSSAGTTKTGRVDSFSMISDVANKYNLWHHVDGAYGAFFKLTNAGKEILKDIELSDSIALDPHKTLSIPYGTGALIFKNKENLRENYHASRLSDISYMPEGHDFDFADISHELTREFRSLKIWLPIKIFGINPFIINLEEKLNLANWLYSELSKNNKIKVQGNQSLTVVNFNIKGKAGDTALLLKKINLSKKFFVSTCELEGENFIRVCLLNHRLHFNLLESFVKFIEEAL